MKKTGRKINNTKINPVKTALLIIIAVSVLIIGFKLSRSYISFSGRNSSDTPKAQKITGPLHTEGMDIFDKKNKKVVIRGINYAELVPIDFVYVTPDVSKLPEVCKIWIAAPTKLDAGQVADWGFNAVRVPVNWHELERVPPKIDEKGIWHHTWNVKYLQALDELINQITRQKLAVILDMHQYLWSPAFKYIHSEDGTGCAGSGFPEWLYPDPSKITFQNARCDFFKGIKYDQSPVNPQDGFIKVWEFLVARYRKNPRVVAADLINEPWSAKGICNAKDLNLEKFYLKLGKAVQLINPDILLIMEDSQDNEENNFSITGKIPLENWVYAFNLYTLNFQPEGKNRLDKYYERAQNWNVPLFVGEFDAYGKAANKFLPNSRWQNETKQLILYMYEKKINWTFWAYSGFYSLLQPNSYLVKEDLLKTLQEGF